tara:strand:+ start:289 stop:483 length:195 start_codon:yes stop_codon:yes gene_type:complete
MLYSLRYLLSLITLLIAIFSILQGSYYPFIFLPFVYKIVIKKKLIDRDKNYASKEERKLIATYE